MPVNQSVCIPMLLPGHKWDRDLFDRIASMGYGAVEFWSRVDIPEYEQVFTQAAEAGLRIATICGHGTLADGMNKPENHARIIDEVHVVSRPMVLLMTSGIKTREWDSRTPETDMVRAAGAAGERNGQGQPRAVGIIHKGEPHRRGFTSRNVDRFVPQPAHHIEVQHGPGLHQWYGRGSKDVGA